ncbi:MAG: ComF family protein [Nitrospira sp.]|nr:ComF family protein [Nitrospira sp.]
MTSRLLRRFLHTVFPMNCRTCDHALDDDPIPFFCQRCWNDITPIPLPSCPRCAHPFPSPHALSHSPEHVCGSCRKHPPAYNRAWTPYAYQSPLKEAIGLVKYRGKTQLAPALARLITQTTPAPVNVEAMIAVPLHPDRLREREFNQALLLAYHLGKRWNLPVLTGVLRRTKPTAPQTSLTRRERLRNLRKCFAVTAPAAVEGKSLLLVDDVFTTGTTVNECAKTLRKAGAQAVYVQTLARMIANEH